MTTRSTIAFVVKPLSWLLGLFDYSLLILNTILGRKTPKFFARGMGNLEKAYMAQDTVNRMLQQGDHSCIQVEVKDIIWEDSTKSTIQSDSVIVEQGKFKSPAADILPPASKFCQFYSVRPVSAKNHNSNVTIIMLPATGEMGKSTRLVMAQHLAQQYGWTSWVVTAPYYGSRKPSHQRLFFLETVGDVLAQSQAIIQETAALIRYCLNQTPDAKVCITGFSWGAAMSSCVAALALQGGADGRRMALVPYVGCHSPVCLADGVLESSIDWSELTAPNIHNSSKKEDYKQTRSRLQQEFLNTQLKDLTRDLININRPPHQNHPLAVIRSTCMEHDHFIQKRYSLDLLEQLQEMGSPNSLKIHVQWLPGGHATAMLFRRWVQQKEIIAAIQDLDKQK